MYNKECVTIITLVITCETLLESLHILAQKVFITHLIVSKYTQVCHKFE